jgi:carbon starvation protein
MVAVVGGGWLNEQPALANLFDLDSLQLAWFVMGYGFIAAIVPVWLLLAPRDYLSTFLKIGT